MKRHVRFYANIFCLFLLIFTAPNTFSQSTDASISGNITGPDKKAVNGVTIAIKNESTGFVAQAVSNKDGRYIFRQLPLGSPYTVTVSAVAYTTQIKNNYSLNQGDLLVVDFILIPRTTSLQEVVVQANRLTSRIDRFGASTAISAKTIQQIPAQNRNFTNLAALAPTTNGGSVSGQRASSTNYVIDGMSARNNLTSGL